VAGGLSEIKKANEEVQKSIAAGGSLGQKAQTMADAQEALNRARQVRREAQEQQKQGVNWGGNMLGGAAAGLFMPGPWQVKAGAAVVGAAVGGWASMNQRGNQERTAQEAQAAEDQARENAIRASEKAVVDPSQYLNDPDYASAKARGEEKLKVLAKEGEEIGKRLEAARELRDALPEGSESRTRADAKVKSLEDEAEANSGEKRAVAAGVSQEALAEAFNKRVTSEGAQAAAAAAVAAARGDRSGQIEAQRT
jgi:hypothetical protein